MRGIIKSFLETKEYSFIQGEDGKDYFFHVDEVTDKTKKITEDLPVEFEESLSPKGYSAKKVNLSSENLLYEMPGGVIAVKGDAVKGWTIVETASHYLETESDNSPDEAREKLLAVSQRLGITGLIKVHYFKTKGREGNYTYTVHNYRGIPVALARKSLCGAFRYDQLPSFQIAFEGYLKTQAKRRLLILRLKLTAVAFVLGFLLMPTDRFLRPQGTLFVIAAALIALGITWGTKLPEFLLRKPMKVT